MTELQKSPQVDLKGYLLRYETFKGRSGWKKRWAVLCDFCLYLYKDPSSKECFFALLLPSSQVTQSHDSSGQYRSSIKVEESNQQPVYLSTETPLDFEMWFEALLAASQMQRVLGNQSQQQFSHSERIVTETTTTTQQQQRQQDSEMLRGQYGGVAVDYRDNASGGGGLRTEQQLAMRTSQPTLAASADGQYSVRETRTTTAVDRGSSDRIARNSGGFRVSSVANGPSDGGRMEITTTEQRTTYGGNGGGQFESSSTRATTSQQQQQQSSSSSTSGAGLVRAEPMIVTSQQQQLLQQEAVRRPSDLTGRYEVRVQRDHQQQQQQPQQPQQGVAGGSYGLGASNFSIHRRAIETVREDPQMDDSDVLATAPLDEIKRKYPVSGLAKRMSIAASDLLGKSHDELLLLLIQLNREKASLERRRDYCLALLRRQPDMRAADRVRGELRDIENQIELHDPLISFIDNIIAMGSLYSGDDVMFASEYRQHLLQPGELKPVKENVGFLRRQQEREVARQFSDQLPHDSVDAAVIVSGGAESQEFTKTRLQLEAELQGLESVYAEHRRRKGSLATFMTELGRRAATGSGAAVGASAARFGGGSRQVSGSYLETDLDTGATIDLSAKFPQRRTAFADRPDGKARTMPAAGASNGGGSVKPRASASLDRRVVSSVSDEVFHRQQQQQQQQRHPAASEPAARGHTVVVTGGGGDGGGSYGTTKTTTTKTTVVERQERDQQPSFDDAESSLSRRERQYGAAPDMSVRVNRIPDPDDFVRQRATTTTKTHTSSSAAASSSAGLPPGQPPPEVYVSQPQLYKSTSGGGGGGGANHTMSVQDKLNLALGIDTTDSGRQQQQREAQRQQSAASTLGAKKPLISLDTSRYKRTTNFSSDLDHGDHRDEALNNLGHFVEDMRGLQRGTYQKSDQ